MRQIRKVLGSFLVTGEKIHVSDPCYDYPSTGAVTLSNVLSGEYLATIILCDMGRCGTHTAKLSINHGDYTKVLSEVFTGNVAVDSGQAGFFDDLYYQKNQGGEFGEIDSFYGLACALTLSKNYGGIMHNRGVVSETGFGDGSYDLFIGKNMEGKIVSASIIFIDDYELEEG